MQCVTVQRLYTLVLNKRFFVKVFSCCLKPQSLPHTAEPLHLNLLTHITAITAIFKGCNVYKHGRLSSVP